MLFIISLTVSQLFPLAFPVHRLRVFLHCLLPLSLPLSIDLLMFYKHIVVFTGSNLFELDSSVSEYFLWRLHVYVLFPCVCVCVCIYK